jgi:hypothetical protein
MMVVVSNRILISNYLDNVILQFCNENGRVDGYGFETVTLDSRS